LPPNASLRLKKAGRTAMHRVAIGRAREANDYFPRFFDILRLNIGDFIEYRQIFSLNWPDMDMDPVKLKGFIFQEINKVLSTFKITLLLISLYKFKKFFELSEKSATSVTEVIKEMCKAWSYSESIIVNNTTRKVWEEETPQNLTKLYNSNAYLVLFNPI
jgi:hypothetical protein